MNFWTGTSDIDYTEPYMFGQEGKQSGYQGYQLPNRSTKPKPE